MTNTKTNNKLGFLTKTFALIGSLYLTNILTAVACPNPGCPCNQTVCENFKSGFCSIYTCVKDASAPKKVHKKKSKQKNPKKSQPVVADAKATS